MVSDTEDDKLAGTGATRNTGTRYTTTTNVPPLNTGASAASNTATTSVAPSGTTVPGPPLLHAKFAEMMQHVLAMANDMGYTGNETVIVRPNQHPAEPIPTPADNPLQARFANLIDQANAMAAGLGYTAHHVHPPLPNQLPIGPAPAQPNPAIPTPARPTVPLHHALAQFRRYDGKGDAKEFVDRFIVDLTNIGYGYQWAINNFDRVLAGSALDWCKSNYQLVQPHSTSAATAQVAFTK